MAPGQGTREGTGNSNSEEEKLEEKDCGVDWTGPVTLALQGSPGTQVVMTDNIISPGVPRVSILIYYCVLCTEIDVSLL